jgi:hypothetical protein
LRPISRPISSNRGRGFLKILLVLDVVPFEYRPSLPASDLHDDTFGYSGSPVGSRSRAAEVMRDPASRDSSLSDRFMPELVREVADPISSPMKDPPNDHTAFSLEGFRLLIPLSKRRERSGWQVGDPALTILRAPHVECDLANIEIQLSPLEPKQLVTPCSNPTRGDDKGNQPIVSDVALSDCW